MSEIDPKAQIKEELSSTKEAIESLIENQKNQIKETEKLKKFVDQIAMPAVSMRFQDVGFVGFAIKDFAIGGFGSIAIFYIIQVVDLIIGLSSKPESYERVEFILSWIQSSSIVIVFTTLFLQLCIKSFQSIIMETDRVKTEVYNVVREHIEELKNADSSTDKV